jgi:membrane fusion protein (multidrug efflux system)
MSAMQTDTGPSPYAAAQTGPFGTAKEFIGRLRADRGLLRRVLMIGGVSLVAVIALGAYLMGGRYISSDDSYVQAAKLMVSTDVSGIVKDVDVKEGDHVKKGQVLFQLDPAPFRIAVQNAQAQLQQTRLNIDSMKQDYGRMLSDIDAQAAQVSLDQRNYDRYASLLKANAIAPATYDSARLTLQADRDRLVALQQTAATQLAKLGGNIDIPDEQQPQYLQALSQLNEAQRQLNHATVRAPFGGIVAEVDSLQPGTLVISAMSAFSSTSAVGLVATDDVWVESNMKETDLTHMHKGDPVSFTVDTYPGHTWHGHVEAVSAATGSAFSVLPSENASGNWVKVTQRISVKIAIDRKPGDPELRAGMSAVVDVDTGHRRWWRMLFGD